MPEPQRVGPGFEPVFGPNSHILLLGSFPSPKSREQGFYYGHPQNRFWPLLARLTGCETPRTIPEKRELILQNGFALWDVIESCTIVGASDASIVDAVPNNFEALLQKAPIRAVFCNGAASHRLYQKYVQPHTGLAAGRLPSTSPANAAWNMERLLAEWQKILFLAEEVDSKIKKI